MGRKALLSLYQDEPSIFGFQIGGYRNLYFNANDNSGIGFDLSYQDTEATLANYKAVDIRNGDWPYQYEESEDVRGLSKDEAIKVTRERIRSGQAQALKLKPEYEERPVVATPGQLLAAAWKDLNGAYFIISDTKVGGEGWGFYTSEIKHSQVRRRVHDEAWSILRPLKAKPLVKPPPLFLRVDKAPLDSHERDLIAMNLQLLGVYHKRITHNVQVWWEIWEAPARSSTTKQRASLGGFEGLGNLR